MVRYGRALAIGIISTFIIIFGWTLHHYIKKAAYAERDDILKARAKRNARHAARRARGEDFLVDINNDAGSGAEMDVYELREVMDVGVAGHMDEEDGMSATEAASVTDDVGGSGSEFEGEKPKKDGEG